VLSWLAPAAAAWTRFTLRHDSFQHPKLLRRAYRTTPWALRPGELGSLRVSMERALRSTLVKIEGALDRASAERLAAGILAHLHGNDAHVKVVVAEGTYAEPQDLRLLAQELAPLRHRISILVPSVPETWAYLKSV
jgi:hypothetical protein